MKHLLTYFLLVLCAVASAQTQQGYVKTRGRLNAKGDLIKGIRLSGASIILKNGGTYVSSKDGAFSFNVPSQSFYLLKVQKNEYQLCDQDILAKSYTFSSNPLVIVMDKPDQTLEDKLEIEEHIRKKLTDQLNIQKAELKKLKEQQKISLQEYNKQLQELYAKQNNNEKLIAEMAERYSTTDFDQMDDFQRQVTFFIHNGDLARADSLLNTKGDMQERSAELDRIDALLKADSKDIAKRQENHEKSVALKAKTVEDFAADCYSRFELCRLQHNNDSAAYWLELRASKDTMNIEWQYQAANFNQNYLSNFTKAYFYYGRALRNSIMQHGEDNVATAEYYHGLGYLYQGKGSYAQAIPLYKKSINLRLKYYGENHLKTAETYNNLGSSYRALGKFNDALANLKKSYDITKNRLGEESAKLCACLNNMGNVYLDIRNYEKALQCFNRSLFLSKKNYGDNSIKNAVMYNNIGLIYCGREPKQYDKAFEYFTIALNLRLKEYGENHVSVAETYMCIAEVLREQCDYHKALEANQKALSILTKNEQRHDIAIVYNNMALIYMDLKDYSNAETYYQKGLSVIKNLYGEQHPNVATLYNNYARFKYLIGKIDEALEFYDKALKIRLQYFGENHPSVLEVRSNMENVKKQNAKRQ